MDLAVLGTLQGQESCSELLLVMPSSESLFTQPRQPAVKSRRSRMPLNINLAGREPLNPSSAASELEIPSWLDWDRGGTWGFRKLPAMHPPMGTHGWV